MDNLNLLARKITGVLFTQHALASAATIAMGTLNSIAGKELSHQTAWSGAPTAVYLLGSALAAYGWGYLFDKFGRRGALATGLVLGSIGSGMASFAIIYSSFVFFLLGLVMIGIATAAVNLGRFAAAEVNLPENRGRAISNVVMGGALGSIVGPLLSGPAGDLARRFVGFELTGVYLVSLIFYAIAAFVVFIGLRPDPREIGRAVAEKYPELVTHTGGARSIGRVFSQPATLVAVLSMVLAQMVMWLLLAITPLYMHDQEHDLMNISLVISSHSFGMYAFSIISGRLTDRIGRGPVILFGSGVLILSCFAVTFSPDVWPLGIGLFLLGLGWNFCYVAGSTLLSDQLLPAERSRMQGLNDLLVGLASAAASLGGGIIFATLGYMTVGYISAAFSAILFSAGWIWMQRKRRGVQTAAE